METPYWEKFLSYIGGWHNFPLNPPPDLAKLGDAGTSRAEAWLAPYRTFYASQARLAATLEHPLARHATKELRTLEGLCASQVQTGEGLSLTRAQQRLDALYEMARTRRVMASMSSGAEHLMDGWKAAIHIFFDVDIKRIVKNTLRAELGIPRAPILLLGGFLALALLSETARSV